MNLASVPKSLAHFLSLFTKSLASSLTCLMDSGSSPSLYVRVSDQKSLSLKLAFMSWRSLSAAFLMLAFLILSGVGSSFLLLIPSGIPFLME